MKNDLNGSNKWHFVRLGNIAKSEKGKKPKRLNKEYKKGLVPYIDIKAFEKGKFDQYTDGEGCNLCDNDDLLIVWDGSRSGLVGRAYKGAIGSTLARIKIPLINQNFIFYFLKSKYLQINTRAKGTGTPHVDPDLLWSYDFPIISDSEQNRIVSKIEELFSDLDNGIANLKKAEAQLKTYRQAVLKYAFEGKLTEEWRRKNKTTSAEELLKKIKKEREQRYQRQLKDWQKSCGIAETKGIKKPANPKKPRDLQPLTNAELVELPELPAGWCWAKLGSITDIIGGVTKGRKLEGKKTIELPYLRVANVQDGFLNLSVIKHIEVLETDLEKYKLIYGDILYTEGGDKDKLGRGTIWKDEIKGCIHQNHIFRARGYKGLAIPL